MKKNPNAAANKKRYDINYFKTNMKQMAFNLNKNTDADIIAFLETKENRNAYLKELIRKDMNK